jgi:hypothetical protein
MAKDHKAMDRVDVLFQTLDKRKDSRRGNTLFLWVADWKRKRVLRNCIPAKKEPEE